MRAFGHKRGKGLPVVLVVHDDGTVLIWPTRTTEEAEALAREIQLGQRPQSVSVLEPDVDDDGNDIWYGSL